MFLKSKLNKLFYYVTEEMGKATNHDFSEAEEKSSNVYAVMYLSQYYVTD
jgi:hypothetical protein